MRINITLPISTSPAEIVFRSETGNSSVTTLRYVDVRRVRDIPNGSAMRIVGARRPNFKRNTYGIGSLIDLDSLSRVIGLRSKTMKEAEAAMSKLRTVRRAVSENSRSRTSA